MKVTYTVWLGLLIMEIGQYANSNIMEFVFTIVLLDTKMTFVLMVLFFAVLYLRPLIHLLVHLRVLYLFIQLFF